MWDAETNWRKGGQDFHLGFETSHFLDGFAWPDKKFRFKPDWAAYGPRGKDMPALPDHFDVIDNATADKPFRWSRRRRARSSTRPSPRRRASQKREVRPTAMMNPEDCAAMGVVEGERLEIGNERGKTIVHCQAQGRPAARRGDRRGHLAQPQLRDRHRHQCADLGRSRLAARRRGVPRHRRLDPQGGVISRTFQPAPNPSIAQTQAAARRRPRPCAGDRQREGRLGQVDDGAAHRRGAAGRGRDGGHASISTRARARSAATSRTAPPMLERKGVDLPMPMPCRGRSTWPIGRREADEKARFEAALEPAVGAADFVVDRHAGQRHAPVATGAHLGRHAADAAQRQLHRPRPAGAGRSRHAQDRAAVDLCRGGVEAAPDARRCRAAGRSTGS